MFNKVILVGNLTRDVELRYLPSGSALAKISLATNRKYKKQDGTPTEEVCYIDVNLFGRTAEVANQYLSKGSQVLVEGRLVLESWTDNTGAKRSRHTISAESMQMLGRGAKDENSGGYGEYSSNTNQQGYNSNGGYDNYKESYTPNSKQKEPEVPVIDIDDEEIPF